MKTDEIKKKAELLEQIKKEAIEWIREYGGAGSSEMLIGLTSKAKDKEFLELIDKYYNWLEGERKKLVDINHKAYHVIRFALKNLEKLKQKLEEK